MRAKAELKVRLEGSRAATKGVVRLQASGVDADEALWSQKKKKNAQQSRGREDVTVEQHVVREGK